jgi:RHS repeat-associated protein
MKKILFLLFLCPLFALGQEPNYVKTTTYRESHGENPVVSITYYDGLGRPIQQNAHKQAANGNDIITHIEYDAFGRQIKEYLPTSISPSLAYQPLTGADVINYYANPADQNQEATSNPFSEKMIENSPLSRVLKQAAPGEVWRMGSGHEVKFEYHLNKENEVIKFNVNATYNTDCACYNPTLIRSGFYIENLLYKTITKDENWVSGKKNTTEEFKDKDGRVLLKRTYADEIVNNIVQSTEVAHDTYYIYDNYGNLTYVIPPLASPNNLNWELCYQYKYDHRNRLVEKKLPGKQWEYIVYNNQDMPVATGPSFDPWGGGTTGWMVTKYDCFTRVIYTGWIQSNGGFSSSARITFQNDLSTVWYESYQDNLGTIDGVSVNYTNASYPQGIKLLTVNYYDRYDHSFETMVPNQIENQDLLTNVRSLPTCSWVRILDTDTQTNAEITHNFYDLWGRSIGTEKYNHLGGYTKTYSSLDFSGKTHESKTYHKRTQNVNEIIIKDFFKYTPQDRLLLHTQIINNQPEELITKNEYDELGQLISKHVGGQDIEYGYQKVDYRYNIRGWLKAINDIDNLQIVGENEDLFAFKINYNEVESAQGYEGTRLFNGNISETYWRSSSDNIKRKYGYSYDALNRLLSAVYQKPDSNIPVTNMYNESMSYDKNGNILTLQRTGDLDADFETSGAFVIDDLTYRYHEIKANQLMKVTDNSLVSLGFKDDTDEDSNDQEDDYEYDENGNLKADANKGIEKITYNHLNLPTEILFSNGSKILYLYNAAGQKVSKEVNNTVYSIITDYLDGFQYVNQMLNFFPHSEGYVNVEGTDEEGYKFFYVYNYTDHLGNIRVSYGLEPYSRTLKTLEENHYYPFGLKHTNYNTYKRKFTKEEEPIDPPPGTLGTDYKIKQVLSGEMVAYKYKYNGKEWQDELGLNFYDYGARNYDPAIGRWMNIDPLAEKYFNLSPYNYVANNPIIFIDPDGKEIIVANKKDQKAILKDINSRALGTFAFNKSGQLYLKNSKGNEAKYSRYYQEKLVEAIKSDKKIEIAIATEAPYYKVGSDGKTLEETGNGRLVNVDENGGGITTPHVDSDQKVFVSGNVPEHVEKDAKDKFGKKLKVESADILMHELVGHAIPHIVGPDTGNAVDNENKVHEQRDVPQREADPNHKESRKKI